MIVFQWSAVPVTGRSGSVLKIVRRWARTELSDLGWPAGRVFKNPNECDCITVEYCFEDMGSFERAWERLMQSEEAASLWEELRPLLDEDRTDRQLFSVKYARTHTT